MKISADRVYRTWAGLPALGAALQMAFVLVPFALLNARGYAWQVWDDSQMKPSTNLCSQPNIAKTLFSIWQRILSSKWGFAPAWYSHSALCKLSFALVNDKLQEAEESNEELQEAGAMTIISMMIDDCPLEIIYDSLFGSRAVSIGL